MNQQRYLGFVLIITMIAAIAILFFVSIRKYHSISYDVPPSVYVQNATYRLNANDSSLPEENVYLGKVESSVPCSELPIKNFQANSDIVGAEIYQAEGNIYIKVGESWWRYSEVTFAR